MAPKRKPPEVKPGLPEWMGTYGDMVTLLLTFFILLFSMSSVDIARFKAIANSFAGSAGVLDGGLSAMATGNRIGGGINQLPSMTDFVNQGSEYIKEKKSEELKEIKEKLEKEIEKLKMENKISVVKEDNYVKINFIEDVLFDSGKADLKVGAIDILNSITTQLKDNPENQIKVEGHTDNVPMNSYKFPSNWELSAARAIAVSKYYIGVHKMDPSRFSAEGFGEYKNVDTNSTPAGRAKNRRVEIKIVSKYVKEEM